jgi:4-amino-4-deoxy-L-arabinose transferase-like glycosyltransferase
MRRLKMDADALVGLWPWVLGIGLLLRIGVVLAVPVYPLVGNTWDTNYYHDTAASLAHGDGYTFQDRPTAYYPPGYPALLSVAYRVGGTGPRTAQVLNLLLSMGIVIAGAGLARVLLGRKAGAAVAMALAIDPSQIVMPAFLMSEVAGGFWLLLALLGLVRGGTSRGSGWLLLAAASAALAGLTRSLLFLIPPVALLMLAVRGWLPRRSFVIGLLLLVAAYVAVTSGWAIRNQRALGHPVPLATNGGVNLLVGNNVNARGGRAEPPGGVLQSDDEVRDDAWARAQAFDFVREHPARAAALLPMKAVRLLVPAPALTYRAELRAKLGEAPTWIALGAAEAFHLAAWGMALLFLVRCRRRHGDAAGTFHWLAAAALVVWTVGHLPFFGGARYFFPVEPLLVIAAVAWTAERRP